MPLNIVHDLMAGLPAVRENSGKNIFQGQGKVREFCEKVEKIFERGSQFIDLLYLI